MSDSRGPCAALGVVFAELQIVVPHSIQHFLCIVGCYIAEFRQAFDGVPNRFSAEALVMLLAQKCGAEGKGVSTADGIYSAFKRFWEEWYTAHLI